MIETDLLIFTNTAKLLRLLPCLSPLTAELVCLYARITTKNLQMNLRNCF